MKGFGVVLGLMGAVLVFLAVALMVADGVITGGAVATGLIGIAILAGGWALVRAADRRIT